MARVSRELMTTWVTEFSQGGGEIRGAVKVLENAYDENVVDEGIVEMQFASARIDTILQRTDPATPTWTITFGPRDWDIPLDPSGVALLSAELGTASKLGAHLEARTAEFLAQSA
jgi:hypothetical protein